MSSPACVAVMDEQFACYMVVCAAVTTSNTMYCGVGSCQCTSACQGCGAGLGPQPAPHFGCAAAAHRWVLLPQRPGSALRCSGVRCDPRGRTAGRHAAGARQV